MPSIFVVLKVLKVAEHTYFGFSTVTRSLPSLAPQLQEGRRDSNTTYIIRSRHHIHVA